MNAYECKGLEETLEGTANKTQCLGFYWAHKELSTVRILLLLNMVFAAHNPLVVSFKAIWSD